MGQKYNKVPKPKLLFILGLAAPLRSLPSALVSAYPKPFNKSLRSLLAFLILVSLHKQACDAASNQKSLSLS